MQKWIRQLYTHNLKWHISIKDCNVSIGKLYNAKDCIPTKCDINIIVAPYFSMTQIPVQEFIDKIDEFKDDLV